ncbi:MAG: hypothetical protein ABR520_12625 [Mycobacteriales bacterium]|nr:hypothetical protein [Frankia sp.]
MNRRRTTVALSALMLGSLAVHPALAKPKPKPKPITGSFTFTDPTPDPTGNANSGNEQHCDGLLPKEKPYSLKIPAKGSLEVITEVTGDWSLQILAPDGEILAGDDVNPPASESAFVKIKKAGTYGIFPCNMTGAPDAKVTYTFTYA